MHSSVVRLQNVFGIFSTVVTVLACLIAATDLLHTRTPTASIKPAGLQVVRGRPHYYSRKNEEYAVVRFHMDADLSSLFTWNTKEVFVYVTAEWEDKGSSSSNSTAGPANVAVIWDKIITNPSSDFLANIGPIAMGRLRKSAAGKSIDPSRGLLHLKNQKPKYQITHPSGKIAETQDVRLRVNYNVQPWVGMLSWNQYASNDGRARSWLLPQRGGAGSPAWSPIVGGESKPFALPELAGKTKSTSSKSASIRSTSRTASRGTTSRSTSTSTRTSTSSPGSSSERSTTSAAVTSSSGSNSSSSTSLDSNPDASTISSESSSTSISSERTSTTSESSASSESTSLSTTSSSSSSTVPEESS